jgi:hypothetical protein
VNFGRFFEKNCAQIIWAIFVRKKCAQRLKTSPKWRNLAQSGHTVSMQQKDPEASKVERRNSPEILSPEIFSSCDLACFFAKLR